MLQFLGFVALALTSVMLVLTLVACLLMVSESFVKTFESPWFRVLQISWKASVFAAGISIVSLPVCFIITSCFPMAVAA